MALAALAGLVALGGLTACSGSAKQAHHSASATPTTTASTAPPAPAAPRVGSCHRLTLPQATSLADDSAPVPCSGAHTAVTVKVGRLDSVLDGHLLAVDSRTVQSRLAKICPPDALGTLGGDRSTQRLSRFRQVWFAPTPKQADQGADWFRCDVVAVAAQSALLPLPAKVRGVLGASDALDRFGTCGTNAPGARGFARVVCTRRHTWQAISTVDLPGRTRYLDKSAGAQGDAACKDAAAQRANGALKYTWTFEWPTRAAWNSGQRYGYCWVPST